MTKISKTLRKGEARRPKTRRTLKQRKKSASDNVKLDGALALQRRGFSVVPLVNVRGGVCACANPHCRHPGKHPFIKGGVHLATQKVGQIRKWWARYPDSNVGIATGDASRALVLDIDPRNGGADTLVKLEAELGPLPETPKVLTGSGGQHLFFAATDFPIKSNTDGTLLGPGVDVLSNGSIAVAPPSRHKSGNLYRHDAAHSLLNGSPLLALPESWQARMREKSRKSPLSRAASCSDSAAVIAIGARNTILTKIGGHLVNTALSDEAIFQCLSLINQNRCAIPLEETEVRAVADSVLRYRPKSMRTLHQSREYIAIGLLLAEHFEGGKHLRHLPGHGFHAYDGTKWGPVQTHALEQLALRIIEELPADGARKITTTVADVMRLLTIKQTAEPSSLYGYAPRPIINCQNGELWINEKGKVDFRVHSPDSNLTHCLPVRYDPKAKSPRYDKALRQIFGKSTNPNDMARNWNELCGYLIQIQRDIPLIVLLLGSGSNGKTELWQTLASLIGEEFVHSGSLDQLDKNRFLVGSLRGKLLFVDDDIPAGAKLPDGALKKLSEAKLLTGELKGQNAFSFVNRTVPILLANNEPTTSDLSYGMTRRIVTIPFKHRFQVGKDLDRTVWPTIRREELSGVLNRYVRGLQRLRKRGSMFRLPADVKRAKSEWFRNANPLKAFLHERTERGQEARVLIKELFDAYGEWTAENGITYKLQRNTMSRQLKQLGFNVGRANDGAVVIGISMKRWLEL